MTRSPIWVLCALGACSAPSEPAQVPSEAAPRSAPASAVGLEAPATSMPSSEPNHADRCQEAPRGMVCIPGGRAIIGSDERVEEGPLHEVAISTFYIDAYEVTNAAYDACVSARGCAPRIPPEPAFNGPDQPAMPLTWPMAHAYCRWAGKRLPSEAEWEKAARGAEGRRYPWGDEPASCERAQTAGCSPATTRPVGSFPSGVSSHGIHDMAGNGYEWVQDWASGCYEGCRDACGEACRGLDPLGPCAGGAECKGSKERMLKGGSWFWPADHARGAFRRAAKMDSGVHRLGVRCAASDPVLTGWPPRVLSDPPPPPEALARPSQSDLAIAHAIVEESDVLEIPTCESINLATHSCRDPHSYLLSNEPEQWRFRPFIANAGGGYVGVGADQSYSIIAAAKSRWAWIFDYDPAVVRLHYAIRAAVLWHESPERFHEAFEARNLPTLIDRVRASLSSDIASGRLPANEVDEVSRMLRQAGPYLVHAYRKAAAPLAGEEGAWGWLRDAERYRYVRQMFGQDRIVLRKGNLLTAVALPAIAASATKLGVPVRVVYTSNADDQWELTPQYRQNLAGLPYDERSVVLRTSFPRQGGGSWNQTKWDYVIHAGLDVKRRVVRPELRFLWWLTAQGQRHDGVLTIALPGASPSDAG